MKGILAVSMVKSVPCGKNLSRVNHFSDHGVGARPRREYHLLSSKVVDDGYEFWGGKKQMLRMMYVTEGERGLQDELERLADFAAIPLARSFN